MEAKFDIAKAENDKMIKMATLKQNEESTILEFKVKVRELELQEEQMELQRKQMGITALKAAADIDHQHFSKIHEVKMDLDSQTQDDMGGPDKIGGKFNV